MTRTTSMIGSALLLFACASNNSLGGREDNLDDDASGGKSSVPEASGGNASSPDAAGTGGLFPRACTLLGCGPQFTSTIATPQGFAQVRAATLKVCMNAECYESPLTGLGAEPPAPNGVAAVVFPPYESSPQSAHVHATYWSDGRLEIAWNARTPNAAAGDVYTMVLRGAADSWSTTVQTEDLVYTVYEPNGPGCGTCTSATW